MMPIYIDARFGVIIAVAFGVMMPITATSVPPNDGNSSAEATIVTDARGNVHIDAAFQGSVFIGGVDVKRALEQVNQLWAISSLSQPHLYAIGGQTRRNGSNVLDSVEVFDGNSWSLAPSMRTARREFAAVVYRGRILVIGGLGVSDSVLSSCEAFNGLMWTEIPPLPTARWGLGAAVYKDKVYAIGGFDGQAGATSVEIFHGDIWTQGVPLKTPRNEISTGVLDAKLYIVGGVAGQIDFFDGQDWSSGTSLPSGRRQTAAVVHKDGWYVIGGRLEPAASSVSRVVEAFDGTSWTTIPQAPTKRQEVAAAVLNGLVYVVGGIDENTQHLATVEAYNGTMAAGTWISSLPSLLTPRSALCAVVFPEQR